MRRTCFLAFTAVTPALALLLAASPVSGAVLLFHGNAAGTPPPVPGGGPDPACAPLPFRSITSLPGTSNLGSFSYRTNSCISGTAGGPIAGLFSFDFGDGDLFDGTLAGFNPPTVGGVTNLFLTHTITGGTGRFLGASGSITNTGTVDMRGGPPFRLNFDLSGTVDAPAVPEPATWAMLLAGFAAIGGKLRRRRHLHAGEAQCTA